MYFLFVICLLFMGCSKGEGPSAERPALSALKQERGAEFFLEPPANFSPQVEVGGCFCEKGGRLLFLLRAAHKPQGNTWCVPGGKLEKGETPMAAVVREVREETGLELTREILQFCRKVYVRFPEKDIVLHLFRAALTDVPEKLSIALEEHSAYRWVTFDEAAELPLIPGGLESLKAAFCRE
jgi:mutator protein MutT